MATIVSLFPSQSSPPHARDKPPKPAPGLPRHMAKRADVYYFKRKIPAELVAEFAGKLQLWKSLNTTDFAEACRGLAKEVAAFDLRVATARLRMANNGVPVSMPRKVRALREDMIPALLQRYYVHMLDRKDGELRAARPTLFTLQQLKAETDEMLQHYQMALICGDYAVVGETAQQLLAGEGLSPGLGHALYTHFCERLLATEVEILKEQRARLDGNRKPTPEMPLPVCLQPTLEDYLAIWDQAKVRPPKTAEATTRMVHLWNQLMGEMPVSLITFAHAIHFRDRLISMQLSTATIRNRLGLLRAVVNCYYQEHRIQGQSNPFDKLPMKDKGQRLRAEKDRRALEMSELNKIYRASLFTEHKLPKGQAREAGYWAPLMGPFVGARIEEIAQLRLADIEIINGVWTLRICDLDRETQELKTDNSFRRVPIHQELIKVGFLRYLCEQKRLGHERVFPSLACNNKKYQRWANAPGKWFGRFLPKLGLTSIQLDFHSFRYNFKQRLNQCGVSTETRDALAGHWDEEGGKPYMKGANQQYDFPSLCNAMGMLRYEELDLSALYVKAPYEGVDTKLFTG